jgi:hypothetical protein
MAKKTIALPEITNLPWFVAHCGYVAGDHDNDGYSVVALTPSPRSPSGSAHHLQWKANAAFIVRAVNAYDDLVAALLPLARAASDWDPDQNAGDIFPDSENVAHGETSVTVGDLRQARAALLKLGVK